MSRPWDRVRVEPLGDYRIFRLRRDHCRSPATGREHAFYVLEMPAWVQVIPVTDDDHVVLVRQFRHGTREATLEIPGGMIDPGDASPAVAAARELREETGFLARELVSLGWTAPNPATQDNQLHTFLARGAHRAGPQVLDGAEDIEIELVARAALPRLVASGAIRHSLVVASLYLLDQHLRDQASSSGERD